MTELVSYSLVFCLFPQFDSLLYLKAIESMFSSLVCLLSACLVSYLVAGKKTNFAHDLSILF
jgi:hypothetical protein